MENWLIINGFRICKVLCEDSSYDKLRTNLDRHLPTKNTRQNASNRAQVNTIRYTPHVANQSLEVDADVSSSTGGNHNVTVLFNKVSFDTANTASNSTVTTSSGTEQSFTKINLRATTLRVRCTCLDFKFRFATWNAADNSLIGGPPPPYVRKTTTRPPVNPAKVPGVCKHIIAVVQDLQKQGLVS